MLWTSFHAVYLLVSIALCMILWGLAGKSKEIEQSDTDTSVDQNSVYSSFVTQGEILDDTVQYEEEPSFTSPKRKDARRFSNVMHSLEVRDKGAVNIVGLFFS
jgi:hypothetical protein